MPRSRGLRGDLYPSLYRRHESGFGNLHDIGAVALEGGGNELRGIYQVRALFLENEHDDCQPVAVAPARVLLSVADTDYARILAEKLDSAPIGRLKILWIGQVGRGVFGDCHGSIPNCTTARP